MPAFPAKALFALALSSSMACATISGAAFCFNAPQPIKFGEFIKLNEERELHPSAAGGRAAEQATGGTPSAVSKYSITQALNEGLVRSPRVEAATAQLGIAKSAYALASQMPNPILTRDEAPIAEQSTRMGVQSTIEPPWKVAFRLLSAKRQVQQAKIQILQTLWQFRNDLRRAYTELVVAEETYTTLNELSDLAMKLQSVTESRFGAGDVPELDVMKARLATSQTKIDLEVGRRRIIRAKQQLNVLMGASYERPIAVYTLPRSNFATEKSELLPDFERPVPKLREFIDIGQATRLENRLLRQQIAVAEAQLYSAIGNITPSPVIGTGNSTSGNPPNGPKLHGTFYSLNFELPVYTFSQGEIARQRATIKQLRRQVRAQENQIVQEISLAYNNLMSARERIRVYQNRLLEESEEVARLARRSYEVGQSDITATLQAQQANVQIRSQYLDAVAQYQQSFTDLEQAIGEPLQ